ncbi:MAG: hypothetical protein ACKOYN_12515 [Planctomycetota bacterium]
MKRRTKIILLSAAGALVAAVALAPTLASGMVRGRVEQALAARIDGSVSVGSVGVGWFSPLEVSKIAIDGGDAGAADLTVRAQQGLLGLVLGNSVDLALSGSARSAVDAEGRFGLLGLIKPGEPSDAPAPAQGDPLAALGDRRIAVTLDGLDLEATDADGVRYGLNGLKGQFVLDSSGTSLKLEAAADSQGRAGTLSLDARSRLAFRADGSLDLAAIIAGGRSGFDARLTATDLHVPSGAGDLAFDRLSLDAKSLPTGDGIEAHLDLSARVGTAGATTVRGSVATRRLFADDGSFAPDMAAAVVDLDAKAVPLAALQPFLPPAGDGAALDLARDLGRTADLRIEKGEGLRARLSATTPQLEVRAESSFSPDGATLTEARLDGSVSVRPETMRALAGVELARPVSLAFDASDVAWQRARGMQGLAGQFSAGLRQPLDLPPVAEGVSTRLERARVAVWKATDKDSLSVSMNAAGAVGAGPASELEGYFQYMLAGGEVHDLAVTGTLGLDPALVARLSNGAIAVSGREASVRVTTGELDFERRDGAIAPMPARGRVRVELAGALAVKGGAASTVVDALSAELALPDGAQAGTLVASARFDGAPTRVEQRFAKVPSSLATLPEAAPEGTLTVRGLDPSFVRRMLDGDGAAGPANAAKSAAPGSAALLALLGAGPMSLDVRNRTEGGAFAATVSFDAAAADASASVRWKGDRIDADAIVADATLGADALAALPLGEGLRLAPGVRVQARVPRMAIVRGDQGWSLDGDAAGTVRIDALTVRQAPALAAPLSLPRIEADAVFAPREQRVSARGAVAVDDAGEVRFDLRWRKSEQARLFAGLEGTVSSARLDLAPLERVFGAGPGAWSGPAGGAGSLSLEFSEDPAPEARIEASFPSLRAAVQLYAPEEGPRRVAALSGTASLSLDERTLARMTGLEGDARRRVARKVDASLAIASLRVPLDASLAPVPAETSLNITATLSPLEIEVADARGARTRMASQPLALSLRSSRLSDEAIVALRTDEKAAPDPARIGRLEADARLRGLVGADGSFASPVVDGELRAEGFPAAAVDAFTGTGGTVRRSLGDTIDARVSAVGLAQGQGSLSATMKSPYAMLEAPAVLLRDGFLRVEPAKPLVATLEFAPPVRQQVLAPIHPVFSDANAAAPARLTVTELAWPLDGDRLRFNAAFRLETGDVRLVNSGLLGGLLGALGSMQASGFDATIEPLVAKVENGRLTYSGLTLRAGRTQQGTWRNSLVFSGDIDLASQPIRANSIATALPLRDVANWSSAARKLLDSLNAAAPTLVDGLVIGIDLSGPIFDANGRVAKLEPKPKLPAFADLLKENPGSVLQGAADIFEAIRNREKKKDAPPAP